MTGLAQIISSAARVAFGARFQDPVAGTYDGIGRIVDAMNKDVKLA